MLQCKGHPAGSFPNTKASPTGAAAPVAARLLPLVFGVRWSELPAQRPPGGHGRAPLDVPSTVPLCPEAGPDLTRGRDSDIPDGAPGPGTGSRAQWAARARGPVGKEPGQSGAVGMASAPGDRGAAQRHLLLCLRLGDFCLHPVKAESTLLWGGPRAGGGPRRLLQCDGGLQMVPALGAPWLGPLPRVGVGGGAPSLRRSSRNRSSAAPHTHGSSATVTRTAN